MKIKAAPSVQAGTELDLDPDLQPQRLVMYESNPRRLLEVLTDPSRNAHAWEALRIQVLGDADSSASTVACVGSAEVLCRIEFAHLPSDAHEVVRHLLSLLREQAFVARTAMAIAAKGARRDARYLKKRASPIQAAIHTWLRKNPQYTERKSIERGLAAAKVPWTPSTLTRALTSEFEDIAVK